MIDGDPYKQTHNDLKSNNDVIKVNNTFSSNFLGYLMASLDLIFTFTYKAGQFF